MSLLSKLAFATFFCASILLVAHSALAIEPASTALVAEPAPATESFTGLICPKPLPTVKPPPYRYQRCSIKPQGLCTYDMNQCGNSGGCQCPLGYTYNSVTGTCDWSFEYRLYPFIWLDKSPALSSGLIEGAVAISSSRCIQKACVLKPFICTKDMNACGYASRCSCQSGYFYNPATGMCNLKLR